MTAKKLPSPATTNRLYEIAKYELTEERIPSDEATRHTDTDFLENTEWVANFLSTALPDGWSVEGVEPYWFASWGLPLYGYFELHTPADSRLFTIEHSDLTLLWHERATGTAFDEAKARYEQRHVRHPVVAYQAKCDLGEFFQELAAKVEARVNNTELTPEQSSDIEYVRRGSPYVKLDLNPLAEIARILGTRIQDL